MQIAIKLKKKQLDCCHVERYTSQVIHSIYDNMVDELALPCPDRADYYGRDRNILFLLSLIMNRFVASAHSLPKGILAESNMDRWHEHFCTHY